LENAKYTFANLWPTAIPLTAAILLCAFYLSYLVWFKYGQRSGRARAAAYLLAAAAASPMAMFVLGSDYVRWACLASTNLIVATLCLLRLNLIPVPHAPRLRDKALGGLALIFLLSPQASGVLGIRRFPESFTCMYAVGSLPFTMPRHPENCWSNYEQLRKAPD
jgi:hypothetical protein